MTDATHAIHPTELLENFGSISAYVEEAGQEADATVSTASASGCLANLLAVSLDRSGTSRFIVIKRHPCVNQAAIDLLQHWIDEYGDDLDPNLDQQLADLQQSRFALRQP